MGPVMYYDREHGTQLLETLSTYMRCNGNIPEVAALLHVHKHTVRYRLRRVTELTGLDVTKFDDAAQLYLAVRRPSCAEAPICLGEQTWRELFSLAYIDSGSAS